MMRRAAFLRIAVSAVAGALALLSLIPKAFEFRTRLPGELEHFLAYLCAAGLLAAMMPRKSAAIVTALAVLAVALEALQGLVPDRSPALAHAALGGLGAVFGVGLIRFGRFAAGERATSRSTKGHLP